MRQRGPDCPFISASAFTPQSLWMRRPERRSAQTQVVEQAEEFLRIGPQWNTMTGKRCSIKCGVRRRSVLLSVASMVNDLLREPPAATPSLHRHRDFCPAG